MNARHTIKVARRRARQLLIWVNSLEIEMARQDTATTFAANGTAGSHGKA